MEQNEDRKKKDVKSSFKETDFLLKINKPKITRRYERAAGVVVSCKIPILATRVRFPGDAINYYTIFNYIILLDKY